MKYGTPLHVAISNHEYTIATKILRMIKNIKDFNCIQEINRFDEDGNTTMHLLMRSFNVDGECSEKIARSLMKKGASLTQKNSQSLTPMHVALYYAQNEAIEFALAHNQQLRRSGNKENYPVFDFQEQAGKHLFTPLHYAVHQNNFSLLMLILNSEERLDHGLKDIDGRRAIDLCNSISSIYKTLRL
jgi:ankyrin repeat protein